MLEGFIKDIAGIEVWSDEDVGATFEWATRCFLGRDTGINCGVKLHFSIDEPVGMIGLDAINDVMDFVEVRVFATGTVGGIGKHGDFGLMFSKRFKCGRGVFDDSVKLVIGWVFVDSPVGESEDLIPFLTNEATGEELGF